MRHNHRYTDRAEQLSRGKDYLRPARPEEERAQLCGRCDTISNFTAAQSKRGMSSCLGRAAVPVKRVWLGLRARVGLRRTTGLGELRKEVRTCEYGDVHVMWELLGGMDVGAPRQGAPATAGKKQRRMRTRKAGAGAAAWSRLFSSCCAF